MRILIAAMKMEQGGAETHVFELCRALAARGHRVTLASAGGEWAERLKAEGVETVTVPMHKKTGLPKALFLLLSLTRRERFDLIHAHARIPAFLCGIVSRLRGIPLGVTVHFPFRAGVLTGRLSQWGQAQLAVSEEIRQYLYDVYALPHETVKGTVNGIDTDRFRPRTPDADDFRAFGADPGCRHRILSVCRLDRNADETPRRLLALMPRLKARFPDLELLIAGDGDDAKNLRKNAPEGAFFVGKRYDIERFLSLPGVFVGVSRAALEAMACGRAVILSGPQGYAGIYGAEKEEEAILANFCAFGGKADADALFGDLCKLLSLPPQTTDGMGRRNRETVCARCSVGRMTDDAEAMYARLLGSRGTGGQVTVGGYIGAGNCGDETIVSQIVSALRQGEDPPRITVLSRTPRKTAMRYAVRSVPCFDPIRVRRALKKSDLFVCGGALLTDASSRRSLAYYARLLREAKKRGCRVMLWAGGIGPLRDEKSEKRAADALRSVDLCAVRDEYSLGIAKRLGVPEERLLLCADPAFLPLSAEPERIAWLKRSLCLPPDAYAVSLRVTPQTDGTWMKRLVSLLGAEKGTPCFLPMQKEDLPLLREAASAVGGRVLPLLSGAELEGLLPAFSRLAAMRCHALLLGAKAGIPLACLSYDPKTDALASALGVPCFQAGDLPRELTFSRADPAIVSVLRTRAYLPAAEARGLLSSRRKG